MPAHLSTRLRGPSDPWYASCNYTYRPRGREGDNVAQRKASGKKAADTHVVTYRVGAQTYQIDTSKQKVYRQFVEIETSRAFEIYASWRAQQATA
jgi:hypothetical protein